MSSPLLWTGMHSTDLQRLSRMWASLPYSRERSPSSRMMVSAVRSTNETMPSGTSASVAGRLEMTQESAAPEWLSACIS